MMPATPTTRLSTSQPRVGAGRLVVIVGVMGTLLPLAALAALYLLAPWPLTDATIQTLRLANRFAGALVLAHWAFTAAFALSQGVLRRPAPRAVMARPQPVRFARTSAA